MLVALAAAVLVLDRWEGRWTVRRVLLAALLLGVLRALGGCLLAIGITALVLVNGPIRRGERWAAWTLLILIGVVGGALTFGFIGVFLGPTVLAVGYQLIEEWSRDPLRRPDDPRGANIAG